MFAAMDNCAFYHPNYELESDGMLTRKSGAADIFTSDARNAEDASVIEAITEYVQAKMRCVNFFILTGLMVLGQWAW